jgi:hypothetical protein
MEWQMNLATTVFLISASLANASEPICFNSGKLKNYKTKPETGFTTRGDSQKGLYPLENDEFLILDKKTGISELIANPFPGAQVFLEVGDRSISMQDNEQTVQLMKVKTLQELVNLGKNMKTKSFDLETKKITSKSAMTNIDIKGVKGNLIGQKDNKFLLIKTKSGKVESVPFDIQREMNSSNTNETAQEKYRPYLSGNNLPNIEMTQKTRELTIQRGEKTVAKYTMPGSDGYLRAAISSDGKTFSVGIPKDSPVPGESSANNVMIFNTESGEQRKIILPPSYSPPSNVSQSGRSAISSLEGKMIIESTHEDRVTKIVDFKTGEITDTSLKGLSNLAYNDSDGLICGRTSSWSEAIRHQCFDSKTFQKKRDIAFPIAIENSHLESMPNDSFLVTYSYSNGLPNRIISYAEVKLVCAQDIPTVECNCLVPSTKVGAQTKVIQDLTIVALCSADFEESAWSAVTTMPKDSYTEAEAVRWLQRFSKPGGFEPSKHSGIIAGLMNSKLNEGYPDEMSAALVGINHASPFFMLSLIEKYPDLKKMKASSKLECVSGREKEALSDSIGEFIKIELKALRRPKYAELSLVLNMAKAGLSEAKREELSEEVAEKLAQGAADSDDLHNVFQSKLYKFALNRVKKDLDLKYKNITDMTTLRSESQLQTVVLGLDDFPGAKATEFGMFKKVDSMVLATDVPQGGTKIQTVNWNYAGKAYTGEIELKRDKVDKDLVTKSKGPNYSEMWKEGSFRGVVVAGTNMGAQLSETVMQEYLEYYTKEGFTFGAAQDNVDLKNYLKEKTSGKEPMHYFVKEAHSDGDEKNLFQIDKQAKIMIGTKKVGDKTEYVDLVFPAKERGATQFLSNADFGEWMRERDKNNQSELVYLNSSCWSKTKAVYEIPAAGTAKFINLPTTTMMTVFQNKETNAMRSALHGVRKNLDFAGIRGLMSADKDYREGRENIMIFPDQPEYQNHISNVLSTPIQVNSRIVVSNNGVKEPYSIQEAR